MRWIVGIDLLDHAGGAMQMAGWLRTQRRPDCEQEFIALHVLGDDVTGNAEGEALAAVLERGRAAMRAAMQPSGVVSPFVDLVVEPAADAIAGLVHAAETPGIAGLLVGRLAARDSRALVRLGRVTRNLLRRLPAPVMVAPPDLQRAEIGKGPLLVATDLAPTSIAAVRMATRLAAELERELVVAHVDPSVQVVPSFVGEGAVLAMRMPRRTIGDVAQWMATHELGHAEPRILDGTIVEALLDEAARIDAPILVCGAEHLSPVERFFTASIAGDLARLSDRAVLVVPEL
jgi:nucleotide-binding universal stress UspA family protein